MTIAAVISSDRALEVTETDCPTPSSGEVSIDVAYCGLCGSDIHFFMDPPEPMAGHILGHEFSGVISAVADDVLDWAVGDRVVVLPIDPCGQCPACLSNDDNAICIAGVFAGPGLGRAGGLASTVTVPSHMLCSVPGELSLRDAALTEPLAVAVRAVSHARVEAGDAVVVIGAGPIGLLCTEALHARGITDILVVEPNPERREQALNLGAAVTNPDDAAQEIAGRFPHGPRAAIDCSGHPSVAQQALDFLQYGARLVIVGIPTKPSEVLLTSVVLNELTIVGSTAYSRSDFKESLQALASGKVNRDALITSVVNLDDADAAIRDLASGKSRDVKVLISHAPTP